MTLRISLKDGEKIVVNGAVLRAARRTDLILENHAAIMRGREVMSPEEVTSPARRLYFACMMAYIDESGRDRYQDEIVLVLGDLMGALESEEARATCTRFAHRVATGDYYRALAECRALVAYETEALARLDDRAA